MKPNEETVAENAPDIEAAMRISAFENIDGVLKSTMQHVTLSDLVLEAEKHRERAD